MKLVIAAGLAMAIAGLASAPRAAAQDIFDEAKIGLLAHDVPIGGDHRESGVDGNGEVLFVSPGFLAPIWAPRPHIGLTVNSAGKNSYAYAGLTWRAAITDSIFADLGLGGAVHDGPNFSTSTDHKGLGTRVLFHESVEIGYRVTPRQSVALFLDHISNADIGARNPGLTNLGIRVGFSF